MKKTLVLFPSILLLLLLLSNNVLAFNYGIPKTLDETRPFPGSTYHNLINKYGSYIGEDEKVVYLTFDNGYENGYTSSMIDTLNEKGVTALFFVTGHYLESSVDLINEMLSADQLVANHSYSHKDFTKLSNSDIEKDIKKLEESYKEKTNQQFTKFFRPPAGTFNEESLRTVADLGYKNLFWSLAYKDWVIALCSV